MVSICEGSLLFITVCVPKAELRLHLALKSPVDLGHDRLDLAPAERADGAATGAASDETRLAALQHMHPAAAAETCPSRGETRTLVCADFICLCGSF